MKKYAVTAGQIVDTAFPLILEAVDEGVSSIGINYETACAGMFSLATGIYIVGRGPTSTVSVAAPKAWNITSTYRWQLWAPELEMHLCYYINSKISPFHWGVPYGWTKITDARWMVVIPLHQYGMCLFSGCAFKAFLLYDGHWKFTPTGVNKVGIIIIKKWQD